MQIIVPMSGFGERFKKLGYSLPKPLIEVEGKPMIAHVIDLFSKEDDFIFIVNEEHLKNKNFNLYNKLKKYCPNGKIYSIPKHKLGPIHAINMIKSKIKKNEETIVNYCDFSCYWNYKDFKNFIEKHKPHGAIPAYKNFHPHSLNKTNYAYLKYKNSNALDIQEKEPFTQNKMNEFASSGTYYFKNANLMFKAFSYVFEKNLEVNGEYYVSLAYKYLFKLKKTVLIYELQHFMQWGTPEDLEEYKTWSNIFKNILNIKNNKQFNWNCIIPMAGRGQRFIDEGYETPKPLIQVSGRKMFIQAINLLPQVKNYSFTLRKDFRKNNLNTIKNKNKLVFFNHLMKDTNGQATSAKLALDRIYKSNKNNLEPLIIGACDHGAIFCHEKLNKLITNSDVDIIVWGKRRHAKSITNPEMFGWIKEKQNKILEVSVKKPFSNPKNDPIIIGTFIFKKPSYYYESYKQIIKKRILVNGEYYVDSCINEAIKLGYKCYYFEIDQLISWGTPDELKTFEYWQSCFHKWKKHPYDINLDNMIPSNKKSNLISNYMRFNKNSF